jgi:hypothetical protein
MCRNTGCNNPNRNRCVTTVTTPLKLLRDRGCGVTVKCSKPCNVTGGYFSTPAVTAVTNGGKQ